MRELTNNEIQQMEQQGCRCSDWSLISVADDFNAADVTATRFEGAVSIGSNTVIDHVGLIRTTDDASYGEGSVISVLNEAGDGNVVIFSALTSQLAALMVGRSDDSAFTERIQAMAIAEAEAMRPAQTTIGSGVTLSYIRELTNVNISDGCEINGAARLTECTLRSTPEASIYVGDGVICDNTVIQAGASVTDGARVYNSFIGEACHVGRGFTSENSIFFANSHMDNGESCAAFCGPFSVSHHKSSLLIGGMYSFYNAGSGTNFSNHAYKIGPIHYGTLERGSKTASGSHTLWPAQVGTFSMVMGKVQSHPDTRMLPFSYLIAQQDATYCVPGRNLTTVGTYRDINKWPKRDRRARSCKQSLIQYDWLSPLVIGECLKGRQLLKQLKQEQGEQVASYAINGVTIRNTSLQRGLRFYDLAIRLAIYDALKDHEAALPTVAAGTGDWTDLAGMLAPASEIDTLVDDIRRGEVCDITDVADTLCDIHDRYQEYKWTWAYTLILDYCHLDSITELDRQRILTECAAARQEWLTAIRYDAEREFSMGDVDEQTLNGFLRTIDTEMLKIQ